VVVLKEGHFPIPFRVTGFTFFGKLSLVLVVFLVTGQAGDRRGVLIERPFVTGLTPCREVLPSQRIFRIVVVLKEEHVPIPFCVTGLTFFGKLSLVFVVFLVTGITI
jgi:hypothetical protein